MTDAAAEWVSVLDLQPRERNPRDNAAAVQPVADSIRELGWGAPIVAQKGGHVIAGHTRIKAAKLLLDDDPEWQVPGAPAPGMVPVRWVELTEAKAIALALADNRLGEIAAWDTKLLRDDVRELRDLDAELVQVAGWTDADVQRLLAERTRNPKLPTPPDPDAIESAEGEVYHLGPHRLICGDCTDPDVLDVLLDGHHADALWTDPPYGLDVVSGFREISHAERKKLGHKTILNDALDDDDLDALLVAAFGTATPHLRPGAAVYVSFNYNLAGMLQHVLAELGIFRHWLMWDKVSFVLSRQDYQPRFEPIAYGWVPGAAHTWVGDRGTANVIEVPRPQRSPLHPTAKPPELIVKTLGNNLRTGEAVLDPFAGSGSTLIAAHQLGGRAYLVEKDPAYCDVIRTRWAGYATEQGLDPGPDALGDGP